METKSVLVTGASGGIGRAAARMLVEQGQDVTALDLEEAALKDVLGDLGIAPLVDLPGVGRNLQDHIAVIVNGTRPVPGPFVGELRADRMTLNIIRAHLFGTGPASIPPSSEAIVNVPVRARYSRRRLCSPVIQTLWA